jgi:hypothetical protein
MTFVNEQNYDIAIKDLVYRPAFLHWNYNLETSYESGTIFNNISKDVRKKFKNES